MFNRRQLGGHVTKLLAAVGLVGLPKQSEAAPDPGNDLDEFRIRVPYDFIAGFDDPPGEEFEDKRPFPPLATDPVFDLLKRGPRLGGYGVGVACSPEYHLTLAPSAALFFSRSHHETIDFNILHGDAIKTKYRHCLLRLDYAASAVYELRRQSGLVPEFANRVVLHPDVAMVYEVEKNFQFDPELRKQKDQAVRRVGRFRGTYIYTKEDQPRDLIAMCYMPHENITAIFPCDQAIVNLKNFVF